MDSNPTKQPLSYSERFAADASFGGSGRPAGSDLGPELEETTEVAPDTASEEPTAPSKQTTPLEPTTAPEETEETK